MSRVSFVRNLHIRIKKGVISPPTGYAAILKVGIPHDPPRRNTKIETVESPILEYAQGFAERHKEIGFLSDGRLSQDAYNFAGLKLSYLKKGLNENQADILAKRDVVKNLEIRSMELDLIQNQALKIGIPSFQPKTHLEHIESLSEKILQRKREYYYIEKRENLEGALSIKFQYSDMSPLSFSQVSMFTPLEYFTFVKEHPEYHKVLLQPIRQDEEKVVPEELKKKINTSSEAEHDSDYNENNYDEDYDEEDDDDEGGSRGGRPSFSNNNGDLGYQIQDYYLNNKNLYFNPSLPTELKLLPGLNRAHINNNGKMVEITDHEKVLSTHLSNYKQQQKSEELERQKQQLSQEEDDYEGEFKLDEDEEQDDSYETKLDETRLGKDDICIDLVDLETVPDTIARNKLLEEKLKKNFYSKDSLLQSKINVDQGRFVYQDNAFPSAAGISLGKYARLPTVSSIKTLRHLLANGNLSKELLQYLEREEGAANEKVGEEDEEQDKDLDGEVDVSVRTNLNKTYVLSDLSNIETLSHLQRYNEIPQNDKLDSIETDYKEAYINTVLNVTDRLYTTPIEEQRVLKKKFGNEFIFEETSIDNPQEPIDPLSQLESASEETLSEIKKQHLTKGPIIEEDGLIDLRNTNIYSQHGLYESFVTNKHINKLEKQIQREENAAAASAAAASANNTSKVDFQDILSNEAMEISAGKSTIDPLYLMEANNNRGSLLFKNQRIEKEQQQLQQQLQQTIDRSIKQQQKVQAASSKPRASTSFNKFYESYILPSNVDEYAQYYAKDVISREDVKRSALLSEKLKGGATTTTTTTTDESIFDKYLRGDLHNVIFDGPTNERLVELKNLYQEAQGDKYEQYNIKLEINNILEKKTGQTYADKLHRHTSLYPEYYGSNKNSSLAEKKISESLLKDFVNLNYVNHQYNASPSIEQEDKVDFRSLQLDAATESKFAKEIKEFREKDARGEISLQDSYEFTNYINYLKETSKSTPIIQSIKNTIFLKSKNNELIDNFNEQYLQQAATAAEQETQEETLSKEALTFKQLEEMFPSQLDRESIISNLLIKQNSQVNKLEEIENKLQYIQIDQEIQNEKQLNNINKDKSTLSDVPVDIVKLSPSSTHKNKFDIDFDDIDIDYTKI